MRLNITYHINYNDKPWQEFDRPEQAVACLRQIAQNADKGKNRVFCKINNTNEYFPSGSVVVEQGTCFNRIYYTLVSVVEKPENMFTPGYYPISRQ